MESEPSYFKLSPPYGRRAALAPLHRLLAALGGRGAPLSREQEDVGLALEGQVHYQWRNRQELEDGADLRGQRRTSGRSLSEAPSPSMSVFLSQLSLSLSHTHQLHHPRGAQLSVAAALRDVRIRVDAPIE
jgi:hypothetical protein